MNRSKILPAGGAMPQQDAKAIGIRSYPRGHAAAAIVVLPNFGLAQAGALRECLAP